MSLTLIVNPHSGGGRSARALPDVRARLAADDVEHRVVPTRSLAHAAEVAASAAAAGETAVAFGGDGLIGAVAGALRGGDGIMGVLPGGRGNDFARALGLPLDPVAACEVLVTGAPRALDLGLVGDRAFVGIASCGFDSEANRIANASRLVTGNLVYAYGALRALAGWTAATFTVTVDGGRPRTFSGYSVAVANSRSYGGGMQLAPAADLSDGELDVVTIAQLSRPRFAALMPTVFAGTHVNRSVVDVTRARTVTVAASRAFDVYGDGDPIGVLPATITVAPGAMRVLAPAAATPRRSPGDRVADAVRGAVR